MRRLLSFTTFTGALVGVATGAVFTPYGMPYGLVVGAVLGLVSGFCTAGLLLPDGDRVTLSDARTALTAPPLILLVLAAAGAGLWGAFAAWPVGYVLAGISVVVATPLSVAVTWGSAPWVMASRRPHLAGDKAHGAMIRAVLVPLWFLVFAVVAWVVTFGFLAMR
jgi:hypothetical protein